MKTLYLVRHAKSSWKNSALEDIDRPLNTRGKHNADFMGTVMRDINIQADVLMTSPAKRARKTCKAFAKALDYPKKEIIINEAIYEASVESLFTVVRSLQKEWQHAFLFGHNMTYTIFANLFATPRLENVPTCGIVAIEFDIDDWAEARTDNGRFLFFDYPRRYFPKNGQYL